MNCTTRYIKDVFNENTKNFMKDKKGLFEVFYWKDDKIYSKTSEDCFFDDDRDIMHFYNIGTLYKLKGKFYFGDGEALYKVKKVKLRGYRMKLKKNTQFM